MLDLRTLQVLRNRKQFNRLRPHVPSRAMDARTELLLDDYAAFFKAFDGVEDIDANTFVPWFEGFRHPTFTDEERGVYRSIMREVFKTPTEAVKTGLLRQLNDCKLAYDLQAATLKWEEGESPEFRHEVASIVTANRIANGERKLWLPPDLEGMLDEEQNEAGLHWPLPCMEAVCKPLRSGDFVLVGARPGKGKTSFLAFLLAYWMQFMPEDKNAVWLNNEGNGKRIYMRVAQAALQTNTLGLMKARQDGTLWSRYDQALMRRDRLRVFNVQGMHSAAITALLEENNPGIIIYDMLNNVQLAGAELLRSDERCEQLAQWAREDQVKLDSVGISTWQVSVEGANTLYPPESALMNSKTAIQGACDGIIMLGSLDAPAMKNVRGISMPKTKMQRPGTTGDPRCELEFCTDTSIYREMTIVSDEDGIEPNFEDEA